MKYGFVFWLLLSLCNLPARSLAQSPTVPGSADVFSQAAYLNDCIQYALGHQPLIRQSLIDQQIADRTVRSAQSAWLPQLSAGYNLIHYLKLPVTLIPDATGERRPVPLGATNTSTASLSLTQSIFSRDALLASRTADAYRTQAVQNTAAQKIDVVVNVSKAFYDLALTQQQVATLTGDIVRLERSVRDATAQYEAGVVDKTDAQRATIQLNNSRAQRKQYIDLTTGKYQTLKQLIGYPPGAPLTIAYDSLQLVTELNVDTTAAANPQNRIEFQLLQTQRQLAEANIRYNRWAYLPTVGVFGYYNFLYQNNAFGQLYAQTFPNSAAGLTVALPIYQGGRRVQQTRIAELQLDRLRYDVVNLVNTVDAEYANALATYKGNLANYVAQRDNLRLAEDVYRVLNLQYRSGIRAYLDVVVAENDLRTARLNVANALYQALSSKLDVQRALGTIRF